MIPDTTPAFFNYWRFLPENSVKMGAAKTKGAGADFFSPNAPFADKFLNSAQFRRNKST